MSEQLKRLQRTRRNMAIKAGKLLPINKGHGEGSGERELPQITGPKTIRTLGAVRSLVRSTVGHLKPVIPPGRNERFRNLIMVVLDASPLVEEVRKWSDIDVRAEVFEGFGKPTLVNFDVILTDHDPNHSELEGVSKAEQLSLGVLGEDVFERAVEAIWNNPEMAPVGIRGRVLVSSSVPTDSEESRVESDDRLEHAQEKARDAAEQQDTKDDESVLFDMRDLGYVDEAARVDDLFARYGAPRFDPTWRP
ncbi:hypothetical protein U6G28_03960 [Actinomycetaceae bacterium MB13-C1-2]|nr:hypothetical protein U6G28_03960 [Actinomycetaceae bacterium MB13-C1-2]